jgi:hypothetical protein
MSRARFSIRTLGIVTEVYANFWRSWYRASLMYSFKYNQQDATLYNILYCCRSSTFFRRVFRPSSGAQTIHTASGVCQGCLLIPLAWVCWQGQLTHASLAEYLDTSFLIHYYQFYSLSDWYKLRILMRVFQQSKREKSEKHLFFNFLLLCER